MINTLLNQIKETVQVSAIISKTSLYYFLFKKTLWIIFFTDNIQLCQICKASTRRRFTFNHSTCEEEKLSQP